VRPARAEGEPRRSRGFACDGLAVALNNGVLLLAIDLFEPLAITAFELGRNAEPARFLGTAECQRGADELRPVGLGERRAVSGSNGNLIGAGEEASESARAEGFSLTLQEAASYVGRGRDLTRPRFSAGTALLRPIARSPPLSPSA
jgi:hypothetical protein